LAGETTWSSKKLMIFYKKKLLLRPTHACPSLLTRPDVVARPRLPLEVS
jgi:hypothetical protein